MFIIRHKNLFFLLTGILVVFAIGLMVSWGLPLGIDFTGGTLIEVEYPVGTSRPDLAVVGENLKEANFGQVLVQPAGDRNLIIRMRVISESEREQAAEIFSQNGSLQIIEHRFDSIGPVVGEELKRKSFWAIGLVILLIVCYITFAFRKVSKPVSSWKYGLIAIVTLLHDVIIPSGFFAVYAHFTGAEVDILFVTALLAIIGFSIHDTIVVFDRIRENLRLASGKENFAETVGKSLSQTLVRSTNTSLTVVFALLALIFFGSASVVTFSLILLVGIVAGTYSSIFVASPLLVVAEKLQAPRK